MNRVQPALAFLQQKLPAASVVPPDTLRVVIDGEPIEIFPALTPGDPAWFAAGRTRLAYRCRPGLPAATRERLRGVFLEWRATLEAGRVVDLRAPLPIGGGWTDGVDDGDLQGWRDWAERSYRAAVEGNRNDECHGLPDCLDLNMRPPVRPPTDELQTPPDTGPCASCGRARVCPGSSERPAGHLKALRHADASGAELAALRALSGAAGLPEKDALEAYTLLVDACGDRAVAGALPLEFSIRLAPATRRPDRLRFVNYYPLVTNDSLREAISERRRSTATTLASRWLTAAEREALAIWLACVAETQPRTLGLSIGVEMDATAVRLQVYAHPGPRDDADRLARAVVERLGGSLESLSPPTSPPVLVGIALTAGKPPSSKLYHHRSWNDRHDTGLLRDGLGALEPFNPGWGLAIQEHENASAAWVKWDFPVTAHYQVYDGFLAAFLRTAGDPTATVPEWLSGAAFSPWPTWASIGRGGATLYFVAR